ncbi:MAG: glycosyltransferase [Solirubrobacteraceae bacterium]|jgi:glycosyltransferase involved in cell wall biosynthesis
MRVAVVAEYYPRHDDPVLGVWAHRQALATRAAGAELVVFVLHRVGGRGSGTLRAQLHQPPRMTLDGLDVRYVRYSAPPRPWSYARWSAWAAPALRRAMRRDGPFDLVHAHNGVPAGDAARRCELGVPLVVSVHGGDVLWTVSRVPRGAEAVRRAYAAAALVLANSAGIADLAREHGARETRVVHLGADLPELDAARSPEPLLASVGHLVARKRHADVLQALVQVPAARYLVIGGGPEREALAGLAAELGVAERVEFTGQLAPTEALERSREAWLFVLPSTEEAFGVAYIEAMAAGIPAIGCAGEPGPAEIAGAGAGIVLVAPRDPPALAGAINELLSDRAKLAELGHLARETVERSFTWERCGEQTLAAYTDVIP